MIHVQRIITLLSYVMVFSFCVQSLFFEMVKSTFSVVEAAAQRLRSATSVTQEVRRLHAERKLSKEAVSLVVLQETKDKRWRQALEVLVATTRAAGANGVDHTTWGAVYTACPDQWSRALARYWMRSARR
eukprot:PhM_4_TR1404/c0_g1_i1/m.70353